MHNLCNESSPRSNFIISYISLFAVMSVNSRLAPFTLSDGSGERAHAFNRLFNQHGWHFLPNHGAMLTSAQLNYETNLNTHIHKHTYMQTLLVIHT